MSKYPTSTRGIENMRNASMLLLAVILFGILAACGQIGGPSSAKQQIQTAIIETSIAEATFQASIHEAAQGTNTAIPLPPTVTPEPSADPFTLAEEEFASLIDANFEDAIYNSLDANDLLQEAASDATITEDEIYNIINYAYEAEASILYTEALINQYEDLFGDLASETRDSRMAIEEDLSQLAASLSAVEQLLVQGSVAASEAISQILATVTTIENQIENALTSIQTWRNSFQSNLDNRENQFTNLAPTEIASDQDGATLLVFAYLDRIKAAFEDQKVTLSEMNQIAQLGSNAKASLQLLDEPALQTLGPSIDGLTRQLSRGQWPQVRNGIGGFEASLPQRPTSP